MSLNIIDKNSTFISENDTNVAYILLNSNNGIHTALELEEKFIKEKLSDETEAFVQYTLTMRYIFYFIILLLIPAKWFFNIKI